MEAAPTMRCWRTRANGVGGHSQPDAVHVLVVEEGGGGGSGLGGGRRGGALQPPAATPSAGRRRREGAASAARPAWPPRGCRVKGRAGASPKYLGSGVAALAPTAPLCQRRWLIGPPHHAGGGTCACRAHADIVSRGAKTGGRRAGAGLFLPRTLSTVQIKVRAMSPMRGDRESPDLWCVSCPVQREGVGWNEIELRAVGSGIELIC